MTKYVIEATSSADQKIADEFETGWDQERIKNATTSTGPGKWLYDLLIKDPDRTARNW